MILWIIVISAEVNLGNRVLHIDFFKENVSDETT